MVHPDPPHPERRRIPPFAASPRTPRVVSLVTLADALVPIGFVILLGAMAGWTGALKPSDSGMLSGLALKFCLPALMFDAIARTTPRQLADWRLFVGIAVGFALVFGAALLAASRVSRRPLAAATMQAANGAAPDLAAIGVPIMLAVLGKAAVVPLVMGNIVMSFLLLPAALVLLAMGGGGERRAGRGALVGRAVLQAARNPLVWAPFAGILVVVFHLPFPHLLHKSLALIGEPLTGILLFAMGLFLVGQPFRIGPAVAWNTVVKLVAQPALMWLLADLVGVSAEGRRQMVLLGGLPTATVLALFALEYGTCQEETEATIVVSAVLSTLTLSVLVTLT